MIKFILIFVCACFSLKNFNNDSIKKTVPLILSMQDSCTQFIKLNHTGYYIAKYEINYTVNDEVKTILLSNKTKGYNETIIFPCRATQIKLKAWAMTGLVWEPWGEIYNKQLDSSTLNKCYNNFGTTLNRQWNNNCN